MNIPRGYKLVKPFPQEAGKLDFGRSVGEVDLGNITPEVAERMVMAGVPYIAKDATKEAANTPPSVSAAVSAAVEPKPEKAKQ